MMDTLPSPASSWARWRSETSATRAAAFRVMPRWLRTWRTRAPSDSRKEEGEDGGGGFRLEFVADDMVFQSIVPALKHYNTRSRWRGQGNTLLVQVRTGIRRIVLSEFLPSHPPFVLWCKCRVYCVIHIWGLKLNDLQLNLRTHITRKWLAIT